MPEARMMSLIWWQKIILAHR